MPDTLSNVTTAAEIQGISDSNQEGLTPLITGSDNGGSVPVGLGSVGALPFLMTFSVENRG